MPRLEAVSLKGSDVNEEDCRTLLNRCRQLKVLNLSHTEIGDAALEAIAGLGALEGLALDQTQVSDKGIDLLSRAHPVKLTELMLSGTRVTGAVVDSLNRLPALASVALDDTPAFESATKGLKTAKVVSTSRAARYGAIPLQSSKLEREYKDGY
jgi:hypothetical protein